MIQEVNSFHREEIIKSNSRNLNIWETYGQKEKVEIGKEELQGRHHVVV